MELTKEQFEQAIAKLATKENVQDAKEEIVMMITSAMADIEDGLGPEERVTLIERRLDRLQDHLHIEL